MLVAGALERQARVLDARDMHESGPFREHARFAGEIMVEGVVDQPEAVAKPELLDDLHGFRLEAQRAFHKTERLDQAHDLGLGEDRRQRAQGLAQTIQPFLVREPIGGVVDRAEHQRRRAAAARIAGQPGGFAGPLLVPVVEALQRVDREDAHARGLGLLPDARRRRAVADRYARKIIADLDLVEPERGRELDELGEGLARGHHVVESVAQDMAHLGRSEEC